MPSTCVLDGKEVDGNEIAARVLDQCSWKIDRAYDEYKRDPQCLAMHMLMSTGPHEREADEEGAESELVFGKSVVPSIYFRLHIGKIYFILTIMCRFNNNLSFCNI